MSPRQKTRAATTRRASRKKRKITPEDLLRIAFVGEPRISPDGETVLFTRKHIGDKNQYVLNLWAVDSDGADLRQFTSGGKDSHGRWSPDGLTIAFIRSVKGEDAQIHTIPAQGGEAVALTKFPEGSLGGFKWSRDGSQLAVMFREEDPDWTREAVKHRKENGLTDAPRVLDDEWYRLDGDGYFNAQRYHLYVVDLETGEHRRIFDKDPLGAFSFDWSPDGKQIVVSANFDKRALHKPEKTGLYRINVKTGKITAVPNLPPGPKDNVQWSPDGNTLAYAGREGDDDIYSTENLHLFVCDPMKGNARNLTGKTDHCLLAAALSDTGEAAFAPTFCWSPNSKHLAVQLGWHGETHIALISRRGGDLEFITSGARDHQMGNFSDDGLRMPLAVATTTKLAEIHLGTFTRNGFEIEPLTDLNADLLKELELSKPRSHWVRTPDGTKVHTWVMLPPGRARGRFPAILEVHGGPHAQYGVGFFHEFQVLAAAGYAVFYSNPRGSKGYGRDHCAAIRGSWGGADWVDVLAVKDFMLSHPNVNKKRIGIMGGSYGGYMTCWAIGHTREFRAAISDRCVSNLVSMAGNSDFPMTPDKYWPGNAWDRPETLWEQSPLKYLGKARTPTLIIHSEGDLRCNVEQSEQVFSALKVRGVPTRLVRYPRSTSHGMSRGGPPDMRLHRLGQILEWWAKYMK